MGTLKNELLKILINLNYFHYLDKLIKITEYYNLTFIFYIYDISVLRYLSVKINFQTFFYKHLMFALLASKRYGFIPSVTFEK